MKANNIFFPDKAKSIDHSGKNRTRKLHSLSLVFIALIISVIGCKGQHGNAQQAEIDSLKKGLGNTYKPGFGEIMEGIRVHHAKLWFAGLHHNWALAQYEESLIGSGFKRIQKFHGNSPEGQAAGMIIPAMDSVRYAIQQKNPQAFDKDYVLLTTSCNNCHKATDHEFNVIQIPATSSFGNQRFDSNK